jgi:hypothetical protein
MAGTEMDEDCASSIPSNFRNVSSFSLMSPENTIISTKMILPGLWVFKSILSNAPAGAIY